MGVGWGAVGCNNVPCTSLPLTCPLHPHLGQPGRVGVGWGGVQERSLHITFTYLLTWEGRGGVGCNNVPCTASTSWSAWGGGGGVGWGAITLLAVHPRLGQDGGVGVKRG